MENILATQYADSLLKSVHAIMAILVEVKQQIDDIKKTNSEILKHDVRIEYIGKVLEDIKKLFENLPQLIERPEDIELEYIMKSRGFEGVRNHFMNLQKDIAIYGDSVKITQYINNHRDSISTKDEKILMALHRYYSSKTKSYEEVNLTKLAKESHTDKRIASKCLQKLVEKGMVLFRKDKKQNLYKFNKDFFSSMQTTPSTDLN